MKGKMTDTRVIEKIIYIALGIVLLILPFPRGLYFEKEIVPVQLTVYSIFILWTIYKLLKREKLQLNSYLTIGVCILPIAYMLPAFLGYAGNMSDAVNYIMRYVAYLGVFLIASDMTKNKEQLKIWLYFIAVSGVMAALLGVDSLAGGELGVKVGLQKIGFEGNRLSGVMQYANTAGMHYGMIFFVLTAIAILSKQKFVKVICSSLMFIQLTALMLTISRGAIILLPVIYLILLILLPEKTKKIEMVLLTIAPVLITLILYQPLQTASPIISEGTGTVSKVWLLIFVGTVVTLAVTFILLLLTNVLNKISERNYNIAFVSIMALLIVLVAIIFVTGAYKKIIPEELLNRFLQTGSQATSGRTDFYRDGLKVLKGTWLLGAGGGAWNALYRAYQSYNYGSSEAHNMLLQVWLETGIIGISAYIFIIFTALKTYVDCRKKKINTDMVILLLAIIMYTIGHSMVDFDFSYFSIPIIVFVLLGALNGISQPAQSNKSIAKIKSPAWIGSIVGTSFAAITICFIVARGYAVQATSMLVGKEITLANLNPAVEKLQTAIKFNPWNINFYIMETKLKDADLQVDLNTLYQWITQTDASTKEKVIPLRFEVIKKALSLSPKNPIINVKAAEFMLNEVGDFELGLKYMDNGLKYNPMANGRYEETANAYFEVGKYYVEQNNKVEAEKYLKRVIELENDMAEVNKRALRPVELNANTLSYIEKSKELLR